MALERIDLATFDRLNVRAAGAEVVTWNGRRALRLENGLALLKDVVLEDAAIEADLGADEPCSPGIAFRAAGEDNFELAYVRPHTTGQWDAVQYDPVFHGTNTWQVFSGPRYQGQADVPTGRWFTLRLDVVGSTMAVSMGQQRPLIVEPLAHPHPSGGVGVWSLRQAYFSQLRIGAPDPSRLDRAAPPPIVEPGTVTWWWLGGHGPVEAEENGTLNLNRYLPQAGEAEATVYRDFCVDGSGAVALRFGFSDEIELFVDARKVFSGTHRHTGFASRQSRGYIEPGANVVRVPVTAGRHVVLARLRATEPFGWGIVLALSGEQGADVTLEGT
ncbi:MAG: hypothetical protein AB1609_10025 [Bacillota bacterium]